MPQHSQENICAEVSLSKSCRLKKFAKFARNTCVKHLCLILVMLPAGGTIIAPNFLYMRFFHCAAYNKIQAF